MSRGSDVVVAGECCGEGRDEGVEGIGAGLYVGRTIRRTYANSREQPREEQRTLTPDWHMISGVGDAAFSRFT